MAKETDFAEGMYSDQPTGGNSVASLPRDDAGTVRVAVYTLPARTSAELEQFERAHFAEEVWPEFCDEDGTPQPDHLTADERRELAPNFSPEDWAEIEALMR